MVKLLLPAILTVLFTLAACVNPAPTSVVEPTTVSAPTETVAVVGQAEPTPVAGPTEEPTPSACTDAHEPTGAYGGFKARAYSTRDADTDGHANPGPGPNRNADTHTQAHGDGYPCARAYSDPNGSTDARAHGDEQPYARINNDGNTYADTNPEGSHVAGTRCSARGPVLGICLQ